MTFIHMENYYGGAIPPANKKVSMHKDFGTILSIIH
jgi:hypothetical protein